MACKMLILSQAFNMLYISLLRPLSSILQVDELTMSTNKPIMDMCIPYNTSQSESNTGKKRLDRLLQK